MEKGDKDLEVIIETLTKRVKELEDINKPEMTEEMYGELESCIIEGIQDALGNLDAGDIDFEPGLDYDGKVIMESFNIPEDGLVDYVMGEINNRFKIK